MSGDGPSESTRLVIEDAPPPSSTSTDPHERGRRYQSGGSRGGGGLLSRQVLMVGGVLVVAAVVVLAVLLTQGDDAANTERAADSFAARVTADDITVHLRMLYNISQRYPNTRSAIYGGYNESVEYVVSQLNTSDSDYYTVTVQPFTVTTFKETATPVLNLTRDGTVTPFPGVATMAYSASGTVTAQFKAVRNYGCQPSDWFGLAGAIALVQRGNCTLYDQGYYGKTAGVAGIVFGNTPQYPTLPLRSRVRRRNDSATVDLPMIGTSHNQFLELTEAITLGPINATIVTAGELVPQYTANVIADMKYGREDSVIVVGGHLDSVEAGPGINDNGSGSSMILQMALEMRRMHAQPVNKVRFIWFGAEELGLLGSYHYVNDLKANDPEALANITCMFNFDMVASPNFIRGVYDGATATDPTAASGSTIIQHEFEKRFDALGLTWQLTEFNERSDYAAFTLNQIPAGGLFTGAEGPVGGKTAEERRKFGGIMNVAYDTCYHMACDDLDNIHEGVLGEMANAASYVVYDFALKENLQQFLYPNATAAATMAF
ncbi:hypothetical protein PTSG_12608 [Salpingoeca rosetta]|uniref:Uncharacterized protein n=1 Tax=Salpingoeca rosetta (strain ATCC 50818 / BSB-021) TaxID=946362 RepID=F2UH46_SALR5|nr:uncharacterized protein PTSG_12608 [Salpingoeca rosetta]EGD76445.1 hypothetical protein PTSG_12608 [Salpingoeca rosetta]|eukprot:XP_004991360.1 hypothetical protein PTSG_12608 [Salpingoeca rosetta]